MKVKAAPQGFNYDFRNICFFEIDSDGDINVFANDKSSIQNIATRLRFAKFLSRLGYVLAKLHFYDILKTVPI